MPLFRLLWTESILQPVVGISRNSFESEKLEWDFEIIETKHSKINIHIDINIDISNTIWYSSDRGSPERRAESDCNPLAVLLLPVVLL